MDKYINQIDQCLTKVEQNWPQYHIDGTRNIWILKPGAKSRGRGLFNIYELFLANFSKMKLMSIKVLKIALYTHH